MKSEYLRRLGAQGHLRVKAALRKWDPLGVYGADSDCPDDEYDPYSAPIVCLLDSGASKQALVSYLRSVCETSIEVSFDEKHAEGIVDELLIYWPLWKARVRELGANHIEA
jgi:hypothetical protein